MNQVQELVWFGNMLDKKEAPEDQLKIAEKGIKELLDIKTMEDYNRVVNGLNRVLLQARRIAMLL